MTDKHSPGPWKAIFEAGSWQIKSEDGHVIASIRKSGREEMDATLIATSPYMLGALKALIELIGDEDLPDNGELSGGAICDLARTAVALATGDSQWPLG